MDKIKFLKSISLLRLQPEPNQAGCELLGTSPPTTSMVSSAAAGGMPSLASLGPNDIIRNSGKFSKPTKIPGKNYSKDEIVIRNADSGKGMDFDLILNLLIYRKI